MTVAELIEQLQSKDSDLLVLVNGYEDGYSNFKLCIEHVGLDPDPEWWNGAYRQFTENDKPALILSRY